MDKVTARSSIKKHSVWLKFSLNKWCVLGGNACIFLFPYLGSSLLHYNDMLFGIKIIMYNAVSDIKQEIDLTNIHKIKL